MIQINTLFKKIYMDELWWILLLDNYQASKFIKIQSPTMIVDKGDMNGTKCARDLHGEEEDSKIDNWYALPRWPTDQKLTFVKPLLISLITHTKLEWFHPHNRLETWIIPSQKTWMDLSLLCLFLNQTQQYHMSILKVSHKDFLNY